MTLEVHFDKRLLFPLVILENKTPAQQYFMSRITHPIMGRLKNYILRKHYLWSVVDGTIYTVERVGSSG